MSLAKPLDSEACSTSSHIDPPSVYAHYKNPLDGRPAGAWPTVTPGHPPARLEDAPGGSVYVVPVHDPPVDDVTVTEISGTAPAGGVTIITPGNIRIRGTAGAAPGSVLVLIAGCSVIVTDPEPGPVAGRYVVTAIPADGSAAVQRSFTPAEAVDSDHDSAVYSVVLNDGMVPEKTYTADVRVRADAPDALLVSRTRSETVTFTAGAAAGPAVPPTLSDLRWAATGTPGEMAVSWAGGLPAKYRHRQNSGTAWADWAEFDGYGEATITGVSGEGHQLEACEAATAATDCTTAAVAEAAVPAQPHPTVGLSVTPTATGARVSWLPPGSVLLDRVAVIAANGLWYEHAAAAADSDWGAVSDCPAAGGRQRRPCE